MTLYWHPTGPKLSYTDGTFEVHDLNPEVRTHWRMTRGEMFSLALKCLRAAIRG